jgi:hypothetical protein
MSTMTRLPRERWAPYFDAFTKRLKRVGSPRLE